MKYYRMIIAAAAAAVCVTSCALKAESDVAGAAQRVFDSWVYANKEAGWQQTELGSWIISSTPGDATQPLGSASDYPYVLAEYTITDLSGTILDYTSEQTAKQMHEYAVQNYYGPDVVYRGETGMYAGVEEIVNPMNIGGSVKVVIPSWLMTTTRYSAPEKYLAAAKSTSDSKIYDFKVVEQIADLEEWELAKLWQKCPATADSLAPGVFYEQITAPDDTVAFDASASVYCYYICRRLSDGYAVDTNIKDTAKVYGIYTASDSKYEPMLINWGETALDLTMTSSETTMISGFGYGLFNMKAHEKGRVYMTSTYGYTSSGSGSTIPPYCPLIFDIELVDEPEDD